MLSGCTSECTFTYVFFPVKHLFSFEKDTVNILTQTKRLFMVETYLFEPIIPISWTWLSPT